MLEDDLQLTSLYPSPFGRDFSISPALLEPALTAANYRRRMHHLLYVEEIAQYAKISQYASPRFTLLKIKIQWNQYDSERHAYNNNI